MDRLPDMKIVAHIRSDFSDKFGIPRQSGLIAGLISRVVFEPDYREREALRGIEGYSHLWLLWFFSENKQETHRLTVRPPRLGGNKRMGVFATRSPYRPNPIGLSCVKLLGVEHTSEGDVLLVEGADLLDGTPILDIKPYLPFTDCRPDAVGGFAEERFGQKLTVILPEADGMNEAQRASLVGILREDPRPAYQEDEGRVYRMEFAGFAVSFSVKGTVLTVHTIAKKEVSP